MAKKVSPDKGKNVKWYINDKCEAWQGEIISTCHELITSTLPEVEHEIKWSQPVYSSPEGPLIFMKAAKKHITFGFWRGNELDDPRGLLEGSGEKMRHIKLKAGEALPYGQMKKWIKQAQKLNKEKGSPTKRS